MRRIFATDNVPPLFDKKWEGYDAGLEALGSKQIINKQQTNDEKAGELKLCRGRGKRNG